MDRDWKKEIQAAASLKPARKAFDALWKIRIDLAGIGDFGLRLGEMEEWENALFPRRPESCHAPCQAVL